MERVVVGLAASCGQLWSMPILPLAPDVRPLGEVLEPKLAEARDGTLCADAKGANKYVKNKTVARCCKLVVLALVVGGKFGPEAVAFLRQLAMARASETPSPGRAACLLAPLDGHAGCGGATRAGLLAT